MDIEINKTIEKINFLKAQIDKLRPISKELEKKIISL